MEVNYGNKSDSMNKTEKQSNPKLMDLLGWKVNISVLINLHLDLKI